MLQVPSMGCAVDSQCVPKLASATHAATWGAPNWVIGKGGEIGGVSGRGRRAEGLFHSHFQTRIEHERAKCREELEQTQSGL